jgi:hypothetical protein
MGQAGAAKRSPVDGLNASTEMAVPHPMTLTGNTAATMPTAGDSPHERGHACRAWACHQGNMDGFWFHAALPIPRNLFGGKQRHPERRRTRSRPLPASLQVIQILRSD